jgi:hypothetical protein
MLADFNFFSLAGYFVYSVVLNQGLGPCTWLQPISNWNITALLCLVREPAKQW